MKRILFVIGLFSLFSLSVAAQEMRWENVTKLHFAATKGTDKYHTLQQYMLFDGQAYRKHGDLMSQFRAFAEENYDIQMDQFSSEGMKEADAVIAELQKMLKEQPDMADIIKAQIKVAEDQKKELKKMAKGGAQEYSSDPKELLAELTKIAVGKRAYSAYKDIDGGLFAVQTGPCYGPLDIDPLHYPETDEKYTYTWGVIDGNGKTVIEPKYKGKFDYNDELDIMFLETKEKDGSVRVGARGYDGRVRIPFIYDRCIFWTKSPDNGICIYAKGKKQGFVDFDNKVLLSFEYKSAYDFRFGWMVTKDGVNYGVVENQHCRQVIPFKYRDVVDQSSEGFKLKRSDGKVDVFDQNCQFVRTEAEIRY